MRDNLENLKRCPSYNSCSQNFCPLDFELNLRSGGKQDKCRWMREPRRAMVAGREFVSGGAEMPTVLLNFVPQGNLKWLNEASIKRRQILNDNDNENQKICNP